MNEFRQKYYPTVLQAIHLLILYIFIQTVVDFPLAMIDYFKDTEYLYHPIKKIVLGVGSTLFILVYGFKKSKAPVFDVFPIKFFNVLIILSFVTFLAVFFFPYYLLFVVCVSIDSKPKQE